MQSINCIVYAKDAKLQILMLSKSELIKGNIYPFLEYKSLFLYKMASVYEIFIYKKEKQKNCIQ